jgi:hypothetical protein
MNARQALRMVVGAIAGLLAGGLALAQNTNTNTPNLVLIHADAMGFGDVFACETIAFSITDTPKCTPRYLSA